MTHSDPTCVSPHSSRVSTLAIVSSLRQYIHTSAAFFSAYLRYLLLAPAIFYFSLPLTATRIQFDRYRPFYSRLRYRHRKGFRYRLLIIRSSSARPRLLLFLSACPPLSA